MKRNSSYQIPGYSILQCQTIWVIQGNEIGRLAFLQIIVCFLFIYDAYRAELFHMAIKLPILRSSLLELKKRYSLFLSRALSQSQIDCFYL